MAFDKSLDKELYSKSVEFGNTKITVAVFSYNNGVPKLQLSRENKGTDEEWTFAKLGRMAKSEVEAVMPLMEEAKKKM